MREDQRDQDAERKKEHKIAPCVVHTERSRGRTTGQVRGRTGQRCQTGMEFNPPRTLGNQARTSVRGERNSGKAGEVDDEDQEQDLAVERQRLPAIPMAVQPKDQPTGNDDRAQGKNRKGKTAIRKKRIDKVAEHVSDRWECLFPYENA